MRRWLRRARLRRSGGRLRRQIQHRRLNEDAIIANLHSLVLKLQSRRVEFIPWSEDENDFFAKMLLKHEKDGLTTHQICALAAAANVLESSSSMQTLRADCRRSPIRLADLLTRESLALDR